MYDDSNRLDRTQALRLWTAGSSWFSTEEGTKGAVVPGQLADLAVLSADYFSVPDEEIKRLESVLTIMGGKIVYAAEEFADLAPPLPAVLPEWSPVARFGGYAKGARVTGFCVLAQHPGAHAEAYLCRSRKRRRPWLPLLGFLIAGRRSRCAPSDSLQRPPYSCASEPPMRRRQM
jgi:hypothetical protein